VSDHDTHAMSTPIEQVIPHYRRTGLGRRYNGRHHITPAAVTTTTRPERHRIRTALNALRAGTANAWRILRNALKADLTTATAIARAFAHTAHANIPATWRHRIEASAQKRRQTADAVAATELWWANRSGDYPILIPTQPMPTITTEAHA